VLFPLDIALRSAGGPQRRTDIVALGSGREERNARWAHSRRRYDAGLGIRNLDALAAVVSFFEERRGRLHGFRWRDQLDWKSCPPSQEPTATDQFIGIGDGVTAVFQLSKAYGTGASAYSREITKPCDGTIRVAVDGVELAGSAFFCDLSTGQVTIAAGSIPPSAAVLTAGFAFDVPVRFDTDAIEVDLSAFAAGEIPRVPVVEIIP
jgi:uncharacterized protein (TIGR02217 family)